MALLIGGGIALVTAAVSTMYYTKEARQAGLDFDATAGTGIVPKWVSLLYLVGFAVAIIGLINLFVS